MGLAIIAFMIAARYKSGLSEVNAAFEALTEQLADLGFEDVLELGCSIVDGKLCQTYTE